VLLFEHAGKIHRKEISAGFRQTTNNRMEIMGVIAALEALKEPCTVTVTSDSRYVVDAIDKGWATRWRRNNWMRNKKDPALNADLWERLLGLLKVHSVSFKWVKGHAGNTENERCDFLAQTAAEDSGNWAEDAHTAISSAAPQMSLES
jgi:ribonuclease HI